MEYSVPSESLLSQPQTFSFYLSVEYNKLTTIFNRPLSIIGMSKAFSIYLPNLHQSTSSTPSSFGTAVVRNFFVHHM
jgi:hypothetical protein